MTLDDLCATIRGACNTETDFVKLGARLEKAVRDAWPKPVAPARSVEDTEEAWADELARASRAGSTEEERWMRVAKRARELAENMIENDHEHRIGCLEIAVESRPVAPALTEADVRSIVGGAVDAETALRRMDVADLSKRLAALERGRGKINETLRSYFDKVQPIAGQYAGWGPLHTDGIPAPEPPAGEAKCGACGHGSYLRDDAGRCTYGYGHTAKDGASLQCKCAKFTPPGAREEGEACACGHAQGDHSRGKGACGVCPCTEFGSWVAVPVPPPAAGTEVPRTDAIKRCLNLVDREGREQVANDAWGQLADLLMHIGRLSNAQRAPKESN